MSRIKLARNFIHSETMACPYCGDDKGASPEPSQGCCGESSAHFEKAYITRDLDLFLESEVEIDESHDETKG